jgi:hypothetical protein
VALIDIKPQEKRSKTKGQALSVSQPHGGANWVVCVCAKAWSASLGDTRTYDAASASTQNNRSDTNQTEQ